MGKVIDERIVEMRFENGQFESGVKQSLSTVQKLKSSLRFKDESQGLNEVARAAKNLDMGETARGVDAVKVKFSALQVVAVTALANITTSAMAAGKRMVSALTLDPVMTGFQEYETKMNAVQTIMANVSSKGKTMADVTAVLDELNHYADLTIYNFTEMTRNIGTFTAAGVDLNVAASAIQGISNLAATSGSTSQQASVAMYQLSQAIAAGTVKLQDWNSVVNAGMGGQIFQDALKETARETGIAVDAMIEKQGSFRESLTEGWVTADVLNTTLKKFTVEGAKEYAEQMEASGKYTAEMSKKLIEQAQTMEDAATKIKTFTQLWDVLKESAQSGWAQSWELIIGDFEQAKVTLSKLGDTLTAIINNAAEKRNAILEGALSGGGKDAWSKVASQVEKAGISVEEFQKKLIEVGKAHGSVTDEMIEEAGGFTESLRSGWASADIFKEVFSTYIEGTSEVAKSTEDMNQKLAYFQKVVDEVWRGNWKNAPERYQLLAKAGYDYVEVQKLVNKTVDGHRLTLADLSATEMEAIGFTKEEIDVMKDLAAQADDTGSSLNDLIQKMSRPSGRELLWDSVFNIVESLRRSLGGIRDAWRDVFPATTSDQLYSLIEGFNRFSKWILISEESANNLRSTLKGLFSVIKMFTTIIKVVLKTAFNGLTNVLSKTNLGFLKYTAAVGESLYNTSKAVTSITSLTDIYDKLKSKIDFVISGLQSLIQKFLNLETVQTVVENGASFLEERFGFLREIFSDTFNALDEFAENVKSMDFSDGFKLDNVLEVVRSFKSDVVDEVADLDGIAFNIKTNFERFPSDIKKGAVKLSSSLSGLLDNLGTFFDSVKEHMRDNVGIGEVLAVGLGASSMYFIKKFSDLLGTLKGPLDAIEGAISNFGKIGLSFSKYWDAKTMEAKAGVFMTVAKAIALLAGSLVALAAIPRDRIVSSLVVLGVLAGGLVGISYALNSVGGTKGVFKMAAGFVAMGAAIAILARALKTISDVAAGGNLKSSVAALASIMTVFGVVMTVMNRKGLKSGNISGAVSILAFAIAIKTIAQTLESIADLKLTETASALTSMIAVMGIMVVVAKVMGNIKLKSAFSFLAAVVALRLFVMSLESLTKVDIESILLALPSLVVMMYLFRGLLAATRLTGQYAIRAGLGLAAMGGAILLISQAVVTLSKISSADIKKATMAVASIMVVMSLVIMATNLAGKYSVRAGIAIVAMSAGLVMLSGVMAVLSKLDSEGLKQATVALAVIQAFFIGLVAVSKFATGTKLTIMALVTSVAILAAAVAALAMIDAESVQNAAKCISLIIGMFSLVVLASGVATGAAGTLIMISVILAELSGIFYLISQTDAKNAEASTKSLAALMVGLAAIMAAMSVMSPVSKKAFVSAQLAVAILGELALIGKAIEVLNVNVSDRSIESIAKLAAVFTALYAVMGGLSMLSKFGFSALGAVKITGGFVAVVGIVGGMMTAVGALSDILSKYDISLSEKIETGIAILNKVASGIGSFAGSVVSGFTSTLPDVAANLSKFSENLGPFLETLSGIKEENINGFSVLLESLGKIYLTEGINDVLSMFSGSKTDLSSFSEGLKSLGAGVREFYLETKGIDGEMLRPGVEAISALAELNSTIKPIGGFMSALNGKTDLKSFGETLKPFTESIVEAANIIHDGVQEGNIDPSEISTIVQSAKELASISETVEPIGGLTQLIKGHTDLEHFGDTLEPFASGLVSCSSLVSGEMDAAGVNVEAISTAVSAAKELAGLQDSITPILGIKQAFEGHTDLGTFGGTLSTFAQGLMDAVNTFSANGKTTIDLTLVENAVEATKSLASISEVITEVGGFMDLFDGSTDLDDFAESLEGFAGPLMSALETLGAVNADGLGKNVEVNVDAVTNAVEATKKLAEIQDAIKPMQTLFQSLTEGSTDPGDFASKFEDFATNLLGVFDVFETSTVTIDVAKLQDCVTAVQLLSSVQNEITSEKIDTLENLSKSLDDFAKTFTEVDLSGLDTAIDEMTKISAFSQSMSETNFDGFKTFSESLSSLGSSPIDDFVASFEDASGRVKSSVSDFVDNISSQFTSQKSSVESAVKGIVNGIPSQITSSKSQVESASRELGSSISTGISSSLPEVKTNLGSTLTEASNSIKSKKSLFEVAGEYIAQGMADGIKKKTSAVTQAATALAKAASDASRVELDINSPSKVFQKIGGFVSEGLALGIKNTTNQVEYSSIKSANAVVNAYRSALQINSPSKVTRDEVGRYIVDGIAEGIESNTSAEEAAKTKASNIVNAFKEELDKFELDTTTADLEYKLWSALNADSSQAVKSQKELELKNKKLQILAEQALLAEGEYETIARELGSTSEEAQEAYNKYVQAQIDLFEMSTEIANSQSTAVDANREALIKVNEFLTANMESLKNIGMTEEEIMKYAQEEYGWDPNASIEKVDKSTSQSAKEIYQNALAAASGTYASFIAKGNRDAQYMYVKGGEGYISAMAQGVQNGTSTAQNAVQNVSNAVVSTATAAKTEMNEVGKTFSFSIGDGLKNGRETLVNVIQNLMTLDPKELSEAASQTVTNFMKAIQAAMSNTDVIMNYSPTITPVVDMSEVEAKAETIDRIFGGGGKSYSVASNTKKAVRTVAAASLAPIAAASPVAKGAINFVQNNYSPKALDKATIYRNTKNLFSSIANKAKKDK